MDFMTAVKVGFTKNYCNFNGRASRSEFWWLVLACYLILIIGLILSGTLGAIVAIATLLPQIGTGVRRLHDTNRSGWLYLLFLIPLGGIVVSFFLAQKGTEGPNRFGEDPLEIAL